ncbi:MAG: DnaA/Hda family protein [Pseudomonadota bacterium]
MPALFHLYNLMAAGGGHLLVAARRPPAAWPAIRPDLVSRLATFGVVEIGAPDDALLSSVLLKAAADRGLDVAPAAVAHVLARIERSFAAVHAAVAVLDAHAADRRRRGVTLRMASEVLRGGHTAAPEPGAGHSREE